MSALRETCKDLHKDKRTRFPEKIGIVRVTEGKNGEGKEGEE